MAKYFNYFPTTYYSNSNESTALDTVTNVIARFAFENSIKDNASLFYPYDVQDGETPEMIANKYYGSSEKHWIVLLFNDIIDPQYDWPLDQRTLIKYINDKYSKQGATHSPFLTGIQWAQDAGNVKAYYKTVTRLSSKPTKNQIIEKIEVDATTHTNLPVTSTTYTLQDGSRITETISKTTQTYYDYEVELNDAKRKIRLLKSDYVTQQGLINEFKKVINS
jgi:alpha-L-fucosidase